MKFLSKEKISNRRYKTPEGYLVCLDAIIARTGSQDYTKAEIFKDSDDDTIVKLYRPEKEVFSPQTMASFENKPFVDEHPDEDVNVDNHRDYAIGFVRDVRRATIDGEDVLIANLVVTDAEAIAEIESGEKVELSCGYDCDILGEEPNLYQANIRGNHVALCKAGRAGIARIQDSKIKDSFAYIIFKSFDSDKNYEKYKLANDYNIKQAANKLNVKVDVSVTRSGWNNQFTNIKMDVTGDKNQIEKLINYCITKLNLEIDKKQVKDSQVEDSKWYIVYGEESGYMKEFKTLPEARKFIKETQKFDKREGIEDKYYIEVEVHDSVKDAGTTRRMFRESEVGDENSWFGTTEWGTPKGNMYIYKKNGKIIAEGSSSGWSGNALQKGEKKEFNSVKELNKWLNTPIEDSIKDVRTLSISGWEYRDNDFSKELNELKQLFNSNNIKEGRNKLNKLLSVARDCLDQIDNATSHLNGERKDYYKNIISQLMDLRKQHNLKDGEETMKDSKINYKGYNIEEVTKLSDKTKRYQFSTSDGDVLTFKSMEEAKSYIDKNLTDSEEIIDNENVEVEDKLIAVEESYINELKRDIQKMGFKVVSIAKYDGKVHFQILSNEGDMDNADLKYYAEQLRRITDKFDRYNIPMTYNIGLQYDGYISAGIDLRKQWIEDSIKDSYIEEWWGQTEEDPRVFAKKYGLTITALKRNRDEVLYRFSGPSKNIEKAMNDGYFYNYEKYVKDSIEDGNEYKRKELEKDIAKAEKELQELIRNKEKIIKEYINEGYSKELASNKHLKRKIFLESTVARYKKQLSQLQDSCKDEAIYKWMADPEDEQDLIDEAKKLGCQLQKIGSLIQVTGPISKLAKVLGETEESIIKASQQRMSTIKKVKDVDTYKEVTQELEKETKKLDSAKVLKLINIAKKAKVVKDSNLGKSKLKNRTKVHLDPSRNSRASKEALEATYEVVGFWYKGKLVTQDPVTNQEYLDMSGVLIKNVSNGVKSSVNRFQLMDSKVKDVDPRILPSIEKLILEAIDLDKQRDKVIIQMKKTPDVFGVDENGKFIDKNKFVNNGMVKAIIKKYQDILTRWNRIMETNNFLKNEYFRVRRIEEGLDAWYLQGLPNQTTLRTLNNLKKDYQDSLDKTYKPGQKVKISNGFNLEKETVIVKKDTGAYILTEDGRKINKAAIVDSCKDDMELSAKTSEELDKLMKQYQKKHPTWKFGEIKKDKGLYRCSVIKDSKVKDDSESYYLNKAIEYLKKNPPKWQKDKWGYTLTQTEIDKITKKFLKYIGYKGNEYDFYWEKRINIGMIIIKALDLYKK